MSADYKGPMTFAQQQLIRGISKCYNFKVIYNLTLRKLACFKFDLYLDYERESVERENVSINERRTNVLPTTRLRRHNRI